MNIKDLEKFILYLDELKKELDLEMTKNTIMKIGWQLTRKIDAIYRTRIIKPDEVKILYPKAVLPENFDPLKRKKQIKMNTNPLR